MSPRKLTLIENMIMLTFPVALFVGCAGNGDEKQRSAEVNTEIQAPAALTPLLPSDLNTLSFVEEHKSPNDDVMVTRKPDLKIVTISLTPEEKPRHSPPSKAVVIDTPEKFIFGFASDSYNVKENDLPYLKQHAEFLRNNAHMTLTISGHADKSGSIAYNQKLSEKRAGHVMQILVTYGAPHEQIIVDSYGESQPSKHTNDVAQNRRVELQYTEQRDTQIMLSANQ